MNNEEQMTIEEILENIFDFSGYSEEEKKDLLARSADVILETALIRALDDASEEIQEEFNQMMEKNPEPEKITQFIQEKIPNFEAYVGEEIEKFKEEGEKAENSSEKEE